MQVTKTNRFTRNERFNRFTTDQGTNRFTANAATSNFTNTNITRVKRLINRRNSNRFITAQIRTGLQTVLVLTGLFVEPTLLLPCVLHKGRSQLFEKVLYLYS